MVDLTKICKLLKQKKLSLNLGGRENSPVKGFYVKAHPKA
jgi:hypothetical protein